MLVSNSGQGGDSVVETMHICEVEKLTQVFTYFDKRPLLVLLYGPMGAGKTTIVREYLKYLGYKGRVKSPTFTYEIVYDDLGVSHIDLYRLTGHETDIVDEIVDRLEAGYIVFIEWPDRLEEEIKDVEEEFSTVKVHIDIESEDCRSIQIEKVI